MDHKLLGRTGLKVSRLCFGTMSFGREADEAAAAEMYAACRDRGINFFDCADAYNKGRAEEILGHLAAHERDDLILTTKCFNPMSPDVNATGGNRRHILRAVEASLKRLNTDRVEVLSQRTPDALLLLLVEGFDLLVGGVAGFALDFLLDQGLQGNTAANGLGLEQPLGDGVLKSPIGDFVALLLELQQLTADSQIFLGNRLAIYDGQRLGLPRRLC
jgi:aryl-alcohol dehydrogenase-like predicted oxidoreductase